MNKLKSTRIYGDLYIDGLAKVNSNDIITTTNLSSTIQTVSPNSLTTKENRSYSIQRNASGQLVVNIPWTDTTTNWYPTSFEWADGEAAGPTGSLTGTGMPNVSIGAIPAASNEASGIVTTNEQTFKGAKTFTDDVTLSGDLTVLGVMNVKNVNVLETSSGIIFEGGSGSGKVTMELETDPGTTSYSLKVPNKNGTIATDDIMTNTTPGLGKLFNNTVQSVAANTISKTDDRTYGIQRNSDNQLVVNVPWVDNNNEYSAGDGLTLTGGNTFSLPVSTSGTGTFVTGITQLTNGIQVNLGTPPNTDTHWTSKNVVGGSSTASTDGTSINGNTYINHIEDGLSSPTSSHNIVGTGATTVTSDANGKITIHSEDTKTNNYLTGVSGSGNGTVTFTRTGLSDLTWDASHLHALGDLSNVTLTSPSNGHVLKYNGSDWVNSPDNNTDTKNTAGATDTSTKIFLVGASAQTANPQTYTDNEVFVTNGKLDAREINTSGDVIIGGSLTVSGMTTYVNVNELDIGDNILKLNADVTGTPTENAGIEIERGTSANVQLIFNEANDRWSFTNNGTSYYNIPIPTEYTNNQGTVESVGLDLPTEFTVSNSPVTSSGTLTGAWKSQTAKTFFAAPNAAAGTPSFRTIVASDIPVLNQNTTGSAGSVANALTIGAGLSGNVSTYNGSVAVTISHADNSTQADVTNTGNTVIQSIGLDNYGHVDSITSKEITLAGLGYVAPTINNGQLSLTTSGVGLSGSGTFTANQSGNTTFTVTSNATDQPTASTIVARDSSGDVRAASKFYYGSNAYTEYNSTDESIDFVFTN